MRAEPVRVVVVTMDSHLAHAAARAEAILQRELPGLTLAVHTADEWGDDPAALAACHAAIAQADLIVATMLFLDEHVQAVRSAIAARREACDGVVAIMSASPIVKLTRIGRLDMAREATGITALLKRLRGARKDGAGKAGGDSGRDQMRMLKRLPKLLRLIPGTAQDMRAYFLTLQYWLAGSEENLVNLVRLLVGRYAAGPRAALGGLVQAAPPVDYPDIGLYHPACGVQSEIAALPRAGGARGRVGVLLMRSYVLAGNTAHYDGVIEALEARGLEVVPAYAGGLDARPAIENFFLGEAGSSIDALVSLTGFSLVGGPAYNDCHAADALLARLDVPYVVAHPVEFQTLAHWEDDARGLTPVEAAMMVALPELDGAILPMTFGGRSGGKEGGGRAIGADGSKNLGAEGRQMVSHPERAGMLAARVARLVALRRSARAERRLAVVLFNFPPNGGAVGTAAYLSVFESLHRTMTGLRDAGYGVEVPDSVDALRAAILEGNAARHGTVANVAARVPASDHIAREPHLREIEAVWGPAPGRHNTDGSAIQILGAAFGNVFVGVQPAFGHEGDPMRLLFDRGFAPTHAFSEFYRYLREDFAAHAVLHFGTHGALEFMPGKHVGLSAACWPDRLIGDLPNFYLYASNNPSEGALAKRRASATLISHMTPPLAGAGLYRGLLELRGSIDRWRGGLPETDPALAALIQAQAALVDLAVAEPAWREENAEREIEALRLSLIEFEHALIPNGLHVVGRPIDAEARGFMLDQAGVTEPDRRAALDALMAQDHEIPAILRALDGRRVAAAPGGDFLRCPDVLPTGRNLHGIDPFRMPSVYAVEDGRRQADRLLALHEAEHGALPETVAMVLWGTDNLKTEGGPIAQALALMGAAPRRDSYGRLAGAELIPLESLGRPRIDVVITLSGIFRDLLPMQTRMLAEAALLAAEADEPPALNHIRAHALAFVEANGGSMETAALRVFGNAEDAYGANVNQMIDAGAWNDEDELAGAFMRRKGFAYGVKGAPVRQDAVLSHVLKRVDAAYQNLDSVELGITTVDNYFDTLGGIARAVRRESGREAAVYIGDQTRGDGRVRSLADQVALETRTRVLNPKWYEALLAHGYEGVRQIEAHVTNTVGWSATTGQVAPWIYRQISETFVLDPAMRARLAALNPAASAKMANRLIEASERHYWTPDPAMLAALRDAGDEIEDRLEGLGTDMRNLVAA